MPRPNYAEPFYWWGHPWRPTVPLPLPALVATAVLSTGEANFLVTALNEGQSLAVVSDASGAGKSTLLCALAASIQVEVPRIYIRGQYETFAFTDQVQPGSPPVLLLVNEVSSFLPVYCCGKSRDRLFGAEFARCQIAATFHAPSLDAFCDTWRQSGAGCSNLSRRAFDVTVFLGPEAIASKGSTSRVIKIQTAH